MRTDFNFLVQILKPLQPEYIQINEGNVIIKAVKFINKAQTAFEPDILYIDRGLIQIDNLPMQNVLNILCMDSIPVQAHHFENTRLNMIVFKKDVDIYNIFNKIQEALLKEQNLDFWSTKFIYLLTNNYSFQDIIDLGCEMLGNPVSITDMRGKCIGITKNVEISDDGVWNELSTIGYISYNSFMNDLKSNLHTMIGNSKAPFIWADSNTKYRRIFSKIEIGNIQAGTLAVVEYKRPFNENDFSLVSLLCDVVTVELQKNKFINYSSRSIDESILEEFISGKVMRNEAEIIENKRKMLKLASNAILCLITIDVSKAVDGSQLSLNSMSRIIENMFKNSRTIVYNGFITLLLNSKKNNYCFENELKILKGFFEGKQIYAGVSRCFYLLEDMHEHYMQSINALKLGKLMNDGISIYLYEDFAIYHIAEACSGNGDLKKYCHPSLLTLMEYDKHNNTEFTQTLYTYIDCSKSITVTANALNIHRNTLLYRIKKIQEIMNVNLDNSNILLQLHLSFKMIEYEKLNANVTSSMPSYFINNYH
ncbi:MAG: helix-turn-helix domain-containing protein [Clostridiales bacterium]|jgi:sugar diacid utilization regulator|nr:helix-turn-helix domain-containing protein [Eubacteriales bacterium]MDH7567441.1 helix-turn-helix domain-containing protein [Clostridiales bacterium]